MYENPKESQNPPTEKWFFKIIEWLFVSQKDLSCLFSTMFSGAISLDLYINISEEIDSFYTIKNTYSWTLWSFSSVLISLFQSAEISLS